MSIDEDVVVNYHDCWPVVPVNFSYCICIDLMHFKEDIVTDRFMLKLFCFDNNCSIFRFIRDDVKLTFLFTSFLDFLIEILRILLKEEYVSIDSIEIRKYFFTFSVLVKETQVIKWGKFIDILLSWLWYSFIDLFDAIDISEKGMEHRNIVFFCNLFLLRSKFNLNFGYLFVKMLFPYFLELLLRHESVILFDASIDDEHWRISISILEVDLAHIPFESLLIKLRKVFRNDLHKLSAYFFQLSQIVITVKLERTVHDSTVI